MKLHARRTCRSSDRLRRLVIRPAYPSSKRVSDDFWRGPRVTISVFALPIASAPGVCIPLSSRVRLRLFLLPSFLFFLAVAGCGTRHNVASCGCTVRAFVAKQLGALTGAPKRCPLRAALSRRRLLVRSPLPRTLGIRASLFTSERRTVAPVSRFFCPCSFVTGVSVAIRGEEGEKRNRERTRGFVTTGYTRLCVRKKRSLWFEKKNGRRKSKQAE